jgi:hypothetical protein
MQTAAGGPGEQEQTWTADIEAPAEDAAEQHRELVDDDLDPEAVAGADVDPGADAAEVLSRADEGDLAEQAREVAVDEEDDRS